MQRVAVKNMLRDWERQFPGRVESIFSSICNVAGSQLADTALFDFAGLEEARTLSGIPAAPVGAGSLRATERQQLPAGSLYPQALPVDRFTGLESESE
jgi:tRNA 2-thiocytidine biosynthesis protein TtcA